MNGCPDPGSLSASAKGESEMHKTQTAMVGIAVASLAVGGIAIAAQDKYSVRAPHGLGFAEFRGFEHWETVAVSQSGNMIEVILANPVMIKAYLAGVPGNGKNFPEGS